MQGCLLGITSNPAENNIFQVSVYWTVPSDFTSQCSNALTFCSANTPFVQGLTLTLAHLPGTSKENVGASKGCYQVARSGNSERTS